MDTRVVGVDGLGRIALATAEGVPEAASVDATRVALAQVVSPPPGARVLDLGCGAGLVATAAALRQPTAVVLAADTNLRHCALAERTAAASGTPNVAVIHSDGLEQLPPGEFDEVACAPLPHTPNTMVRRMLTEAALRLAPGGSMTIAAHPRSGVKAYVKHLRGLFTEPKRVRGVKGVQVWRCLRDRLDTEAAERSAETLRREEDGLIRAELRGRDLRFRTRVGVFSWQEIDRGTRLLIESLPEGSPDRVVDLGCGYGAIGVPAAKLYPEAEVTMVDVDRRALSLAEANVAANGCGNARVVASDGLAAAPGPWDMVASNIPTHIGRGPVMALLEECRARLAPGGRLIAVISHGLTIDAWASELFGNARTVAEIETHRVFESLA